MTFAQERISDVWDEAWPLVIEAGRESALGDIPFQPGRRAYDEMERLGIARLYTARSGGVLVGLAVFALSHLPQHIGTKVAVQDVVYMDPAHRGYASGRFLLWTEKALKDEQVGAVVRSARMENYRYQGALADMGYKLTYLTYMKRL